MNIWKRVPADAADWFSADEVKRAREYQKPLALVRPIESLISIAMIVGVVLTHLGPRVIDAAGVNNWVLQVVLVLATIMAVAIPLGLPFDIWRTFVHDRRWEFSTQTPGSFVVDMIKGFVLNTVLLSALLIPLWALIRATSLWWLWGWMFYMGFSVVLGMLFPIVIAPLFNKFTVLEDEELNTRIQELATMGGVTISSTKVMDASKRTTKDNAYFAGLGKTRQVVLFDNLLKQPKPAVAAVIAHELGHWRRGHTLRLGLIAGTMSLGVFALANMVLGSSSVLELGGVATLSDPGAIPLFLAVFGVGVFLMSIVQAYVSRAFERQADLDSLEMTGDADAFKTMMHGLQTKNLGDIEPNWWAYLKASHPPAAERLELAKRWSTSRSGASA